jgi:hypothetical protein
MRFIRVTLAAVALAGAFTAGRIVATPPTAIDAQVPQFSHFRCYTSAFWKPAALSIPVQLHDQFSTETTVIQKPEFFCTPVMKKLLKSEPVKFAGPADHLTCYVTTQGKMIGTARSGENQLGKLLVRDLTPHMLCVPTRKDEKFPANFKF